MNDEELRRAREKVEQQTRDANKRASIARRVKTWYDDQLEQNGFREMVDVIVRGR